MEIEVATPPPSAARRHAEIVVEAGNAARALAASAEIGTTPQHRARPSPRKSTTRSSASWHWLTPHLPGSTDPQLVADVLEAHIDRIEQRWSALPLA